MFRVSVWAYGGSALLIILGFFLVLFSSSTTPVAPGSAGPAWDLGALMIFGGFLLLLGNSVNRWVRA